MNILTVNLSFIFFTVTYERVALKQSIKKIGLPSTLRFVFSTEINEFQT